MLRTHKISLAMLALVGATAAAQSTARIAVSPESKLWIEGTSTIHDWTCKATTLDAAIDVDPAAVQLAAAPPKMLKKVLVKVPVKALKCGHGGMDENMYKALKVEQFPEITFRLTRLESATAGAVKAIGALRIAGVDREVALDLKTSRKGGLLVVTGSLPLLMTDYGIKPPVAMLGMLKTDPKVTVSFETVLALPASPTSTIH